MEETSSQVSEEIRGKTDSVVMLDEGAGFTGTDSPADAPVEKTIEEQRQENFINYVDAVSKAKRNLPKDFAKNSLVGMVNTQYAMLNRKERRKILARTKKQYRVHMRGLVKQAQNIKVENNEVSDQSSVESNSNTVEQV